MVRVYTAITLIPDGYVYPGAEEPTLTTPEERVAAINIAADLPRQVREWSGGKAGLSMVIRQASLILDELAFHHFDGAYFPDPRKVPALDDDRERYDFSVISTGKIGEGHPYVGFSWTDRWFAAANQPQSRAIHPHEMLHVLERYLKRTHGYTNWPECGQPAHEDTSVHCNVDYGYPRGVSEEWCSKIFGATLPDGTGINAEGWSHPTPTEMGARTPEAPEEVINREWSTYRAIYIPAF